LIFLFVRGGDFNRRDVEVPTLQILFICGLTLTLPTPPGSSLRQHRSYDRFTATRTRFVFLPVDRKNVLKSALQAFGVHVIVDAGAAHVDCASEHFDDCAV
jgi:hypothetical protein